MPTGSLPLYIVVTEKLEILWSPSCISDEGERR